MNFLNTTGISALLILSIFNSAKADDISDGGRLAFQLQQTAPSPEAKETLGQTDNTIQAQSPAPQKAALHKVGQRRPVQARLAAFRASGTVAGYRRMIATHAQANGIPFALANAVVQVESGYNPRALSAGNYGLMQIRPQTARGLGYRGSASGLLNANTNLTYGVKYLALAYRQAHGNTCLALMGYQSGVYARHMSNANHKYCHKALKYMAMS